MIYHPFQAIILGSDQGRNVYKKQLLVLAQQHRLNKIIKFIDHGCEEMPVAYGIANLSLFLFYMNPKLLEEFLLKLNQCKFQ